MNPNLVSSFLALGLLAAFQNQVVAADTWWGQQGGSSITINSARPVVVSEAYGIRVSGTVFCGIRVSSIFNENVWGVRGSHQDGRLTILSAEAIAGPIKYVDPNDPGIKLALELGPKALGPTELFQGPNALVSRNANTAYPRGLFGVFVPLQQAPTGWLEHLNGYCQGKQMG